MLRRVVMTNILFRKKKTTQFRMKKKWMRDKDRFAISKTGERPLNPWITKSRIQILMKEFERIRNLNRITIKYNEKLIEEYANVSEEYSQLATHRYLADHIEFTDNVDCARQAEADSKTLPKFLQDDLNADLPFYSPTKEMSFAFRYSPQISRFMPKRIANNWLATHAVNTHIEDDDPFELLELKKQI
jgi:hypothetical protein